VPGQEKWAGKMGWKQYHKTFSVVGRGQVGAVGDLRSQENLDHTQKEESLLALKLKSSRQAQSLQSVIVLLVHSLSIYICCL